MKAMKAKQYLALVVRLHINPPQDGQDDDDEERHEGYEGDEDEEDYEEDHEKDGYEEGHEEVRHRQGLQDPRRCCPRRLLRPQDEDRRWPDQGQADQVQVRQDRLQEATC